VIVETQSLTKRYGSFTALEECSLSVERGEVFGLLGPNGAGKTTLIRLLMGFLRPTSGSARIEELDCTNDSVAVHAKVAYLPGDARLFRRMRGSEVLRFFARCRSDGNFKKSKSLAERLELDTHQRVGFMSTGMRQKLAIAATLATSSSVLILDEPTSNLDPNVRSEIIRMLAEAKADGRTILLSSHVMSEIEESCDRVVILRQGRLVHTQVMDELRVRHRIVGRSNTIPIPTVPPTLAQRVEFVNAPLAQLDVAATCNEPENGERSVTFHTLGDLAPVLEWIVSIGLAEVRIEPIGLRSVYDRFHSSTTRDGIR
jgi:ABC-2 type transport system ATP-binding protein